MRPVWCSCQDMLASVPRHAYQDMLASLVFVSRHAGQPGVRAMLASLVFAPSSCQDMLASLVFVPRHTSQPGVRAKTCWPACSCQDMLACLVFVPRHGPAWCSWPAEPGVRAKTCKTCWPAWCLCHGLLASLVFVPRHGQPGQDTHAGQTGVRGPAW